MFISVKIPKAIKSSLAVAFAILAMSAPVSAVAAESEIVVEGQRKQLSAQLKQLFNESSSGQLGRFEESVCPLVIGYPEDWTGILDGLIRKNMETAGLTVQDTGCKPNALLIFIDDPQTTVKGLYEAQPRFFGVMDRADFLQLTNKKRAIYSWHVIEQRSRDGVQLGNITSINGSAVSQSGVKIVRNAAATRNYENVREDMLLSFAVIDKPLTEGKSLRQLADIATMHLLLDIKPEAQTAGDSILTLFANRSPDAALPERMSDLDKRTVAGLYDLTGNNYKASVQRGRMASKISQDLEKEDAAAPEKKQ